MINQEELRKKRIERLNYIRQKLEEKFEKILINDEECYVLPNGVVINVVGLGGEYDALVIEFAENIKEAKNYNSDDGSLYFMDELGPEEMINKMMEEIKNEM